MGGIGGGEKEGGSRHFSELLKMDRTDDEMEPCVKASRVGRESGLENASSGSSSALPLQLKAMVRIRSRGGGANPTLCPGRGGADETAFAGHAADANAAKQTNEFLNVIYVLLSSLGEEEITAYNLQNASASGAEQLLRQTLGKLHPLWEEPGVEIIPLTLLERSHVVQCFLEEMTDEGFYPDPANVERLAGELAYHRAGGKEYAKTGCKQVVAKVNLL
ncbi:hypothetical protein SRHO_G00257850 [Serrasalmus rhombeus]